MRVIGIIIGFFLATSNTFSSAISDLDLDNLELLKSAQTPYGLDLRCVKEIHTRARAQGISEHPSYDVLLYQGMKQKIEEAERDHDNKTRAIQAIAAFRERLLQYPKKTPSSRRGFFKRSKKKDKTQSEPLISLESMTDDQEAQTEVARLHAVITMLYAQKEQLGGKLIRTLGLSQFQLECLPPETYKPPGSSRTHF